ncbi:solute carrier family 2 member 11, like isoform X3 [Electrophorus electricus]|uniref:solute carrier family 2 member 11, like isoform X3 n=1 Tax=Electrophorus electricus TaxID=8005 RepID=UPI0015CFFADE|nr:solute carrier family 2 member 11, like isoform X3 [Electrophorus electricus]
MFSNEEQLTETMTHAFSSLLESPLLAVVIVITGIGGTFQYGFHISVLTSPSVYVKRLVNATCAQRYGRALEAWELSLFWSFIVSIYSVGGLLSSQCAGRLATIYGRKRCLVLNNVAAICGAVLMGFSKMANSFEMIMVARFLYGINAGVSLAVHTMYVLECAPKRLRGMVGVSVGCFVSMGKLFGQLLGISGLIGLLQLVSLPFLPESPRYLLLVRSDRLACEKALRQILGARGDLAVEVEEMQVEHAALKGVKNHGVLELLLSRTTRWQLLTVVVTFMTLQLCGINAVYLYSSDVFRAAGIAGHNLRYVALGTGLCEVFTSIACGMVIERTGKRQLLIQGYLGMATTLAILTVTLYLQVYVSWMPYCSVVLIFIYIFFFSVGPVLQNSSIHIGVHSELGGALLSGHGVPHHSGAFGLFLLPHLLHLLPRLRFVCVVSCSRDQEQEHLGDHCRIRANAQQRQTPARDQADQASSSSHHSATAWPEHQTLIPRLISHIKNVVSSK